MIKPASPGTGVVAGGAVRPIVELAGIRDVLAKVLGSRNAINTARATMLALTSMKIAENVCKARHKKMEDLVPWMVKKNKAMEMAQAETSVSEQPIAVVDEVVGGQAND